MLQHTSDSDAELFIDLLRRKLPPQPFYIESAFLPKSGKLTLAGAAKAGKSFTSLEICRALATGTPVFGMPQLAVPTPVRVMYIEYELGRWSLQSRGAEIFNGSPEVWHENFSYISKNPHIKLNDPLGYAKLRHQLDRFRPQVLFIDPVSKAMVGNENEAAVIANLFNQVDLLIDAYSRDQLSIVIAHHFRKPPQDTDGFEDLSPYNTRGSSKFYDDPDTFMTAVRMRNTPTPTGHGWYLKCAAVTRCGEFMFDEDTPFYLGVNWSGCGVHTVEKPPKKKQKRRDDDDDDDDETPKRRRGNKYALEGNIISL